MKTYREFVSKFNKELKKYLLKEERRYRKEFPQSIYLFTALKEFVLSGGKRIRPYLIYLGYLSAQNKRPKKEVFFTCIAYELLHNFALVHDDIVDNSEKRRGGKTLHKILGSDEREGISLAMLAGDIYWALANSLIIKIKTKYKKEILSHWFVLQNEVVRGEAEEFVFGTKGLKGIKKKDVINLAIKKSANYSFAYPLLLGTLLGERPSLAKTLFGIGQKLGIAFQIKDDLLLYEWGETGEKDIDVDLREGRMNLIIYFVLKEDPKILKLRKVFGNFKASASDLAKLRASIKKTRALQRARKEAERYIEQAKQEILSLNINHLIKNEYFNIINKILTRNK